MRYAYFYFMKDEPDRIGAIVPSHVAYWNESGVAYSGGPFADRSGGLITFDAESLEAARGITMNDPFILEELLSQHWVKEWLVE